MTSAPTPSLPGVIANILDAVQVPVPSATMRALAATALRDREVSAQSLSRVAAYEHNAFLHRGEAPRFSWVLHPNGMAAKPRIWARGQWRLSRRLLTEDAVPNWSVALALFLVEQMIREDDWARVNLGRVAQESVARVLGPVAHFLPGPREEWSELREQLLARQHPMGPASTTTSQDAAEAELRERGLPEYALYFGAANPLQLQADDLPPRLRLPAEGEDGVPFDQLIAQRAGGDGELARQVIAYVQEWGVSADELGHSPSVQEYAQRWQVDLETARRRNDAFARLFPNEETPERIWNLLWSGAEIERSFVRLMGRKVVADDASPTVLNFLVQCLLRELRDTPSLVAALEGQLLTFEERESPSDRELRRFYALCERALRIWCPAALLEADQPVLVRGLLSLETIFDGSSAAYAATQLGRYRRDLPTGPAHTLLREAQGALRVAGTLDPLNPPQGTASYLGGVRRLAKALAQVRATEMGLDLREEAVASVRALDRVR